jgi:hypothetical protein
MVKNTTRFGVVIFEMMGATGPGGIATGVGGGNGAVVGVVDVEVDVDGSLTGFEVTVSGTARLWR